MRLVGRGGMGEVYEAEDTRKHRVVAVKLISPQLSGSPEFRARMQREADAAGRLTEAHVVPIHDYGEIDGQFFLEMRLIDGTDLAALLKRHGALPPPRAVAIVGQIATALDAAHASGVTHRDIKPENILVTPDDFAYLVDFGIARAGSAPGLTQTGIAVGTYNYMAPERFSGDEVTYRADVYSLACVLDECLTGLPPYRAQTIERLIAAHLMEPPPRPSQLRPGVVPLALDQVIARGMAKSPRDRYSSAGDLARSAHDALTTAEQHQAAMILRQGQQPAQRATALSGMAAGGYQPATGAQPANAIGYEQTMARQVANGGPAPRVSAPAAPPRPASFTQATRPRHNRKWALLAAAVLLLLTGLGVTGYAASRPSGSHAASGQAVLAIDGLNFRLSPGGVTLDDEGNVYVTNQGMYGHVVKLAPGSSTPAVLPFSGLYEPQGVAVDKDGVVYVTDFNNRVVKLDAGSNLQTELPFTGLNYPEGLAVDRTGDVYVADRGNNRVVKVVAGSNTQTVLPFTGLKNPDGVAVDPAGNVYVTDTDNDRVVKLAAGSNTQTVLPFTGLSSPWGVALDNAGNVYVTNHESHKLMKLAAGSNTQTVLPVTGLNMPLELTVANDGTVYIADRGNNRIVTLAAG
ncbi:MAG: serine/threonine-protein kinase PknD [Mycobacterium sp.]